MPEPKTESTLAPPPATPESTLEGAKLELVKTPSRLTLEIAEIASAIARSYAGRAGLRAPGTRHRV